MFNKKKREIERLNRELDEKDAASDRLFQRYSFCYKQSETLKAELDSARERLSSALADRDKLFDENAALMRVNGTLKRELDDEAKAKCEFADKIKELAERTMCFEDCKNKFNRNGCWTCVRYPYKKDKYESGGDTK